MLLSTAAALGLAGCDVDGVGLGLFSRRQAPPTALGSAQQRRDPALSGDGRLLASIVESNGRSMVLLQEQPSGRVLALRHLRGHLPHRSPALSWNGRYLAVVVQQGSRHLAVVLDRATGSLHRLPLPGNLEVERLSLAPDGRRLAVEVLRQGQARVELFDLAPLLEPDLPATAVSGGGGSGAGGGLR